MILILRNRNVVAVHDSSHSALALMAAYPGCDVIDWHGVVPDLGAELPADFDIPAAAAQTAAAAHLKESDAITGARGVEDIIAAAFARGVFVESDFPQPLRDRITARNLAREIREGKKDEAE